MRDPSPLSRALHQAVAAVRTDLGDPVAPVVVLTPSDGNGVLARQQLALAADFVRVDFATPERLLRELGAPALAARGLRPEPSGWLAATLTALLADPTAPLPHYAATLREPGWVPALARALDTLEAAGVDADALASVDAPEHADRIALLVALLRAVTARRALDRLWSLADLCDAAAHGRADKWSGAVILGDRLLAPRVHAVVAAWLAARPHAEVRPHPWHRLPPAPGGLRAACTGRVLDVALAGGALAAVVAGTPPTQSDDTLVLARTPDDVREIAEAVREVLDAVDHGVPLDRIAIVLPDAEQLEVLRGELIHAGIPATWLVGGALAETPAGGFLLHALTVADGEDTVPAWYDLLRQPGLRLRAVLGPDAVRGQGRWRRVLAQCGAACRTASILAALDAWSAERDPDDQRSAGNLARAIDALHASLADLGAPDTAGAHAKRWSALLRRWWVPSADRDQILALLAAWGSPGVGPTLAFPAARALVEAALKSTPVLSGALSEPAVRVTTPMGLLGGAFARVVCTGLVDGRFPRRASEDPILPDALLDRIAASLGTPMLGSAAVRSFEERRFAAVLSSCTDRLWLSSPATELLEERPLVPSAFLLDLASTLLGRRAAYRDLRDLQAVVGSRARPWVADPGRATRPLEHRVASVAADRTAGLRRLVAHPVARRLVGLHRALASPVPTGWTGRLDPALIRVPGANGEPVRAHALAALLREPAAFLVETVLGVFRPPELAADADPADRRFVEDRARRALAEAVGQPDLRAAFLAAWDAQIAAWCRHRPEVDAATTALARSLAELLLDGVIAGDAVPVGAPAAGTGPVDCWVVEVGGPWHADGVLAELRTGKKPARGELARDATALALAGVALGADALRVCSVREGVAVHGDLADERPAVLASVRAAARAVAAGWWPWTRDNHPVRLAAERAYDLDQLDQVLP